MNLALGLFVLSLWGSDGPQGCNAPEIMYGVRVLKMNGPDWRGSFFSRLEPVTSQGGASVWTASRETAERLAALDPNGLKAPKVTALPMAPVHVFDRVTRKVASGVTRLADGPFDHATKVAYTPNYEEIREGFAVTMSGRKLDQGVLTCVVLDDTRIAGVHCVALTESVSEKRCCTEGDAACDKVASRIEIPEVVHAAVAGEWLIPSDGALVVSLGLQTTLGAGGKAVVVERLVLIEARPAGDAAVKQAAAMSRSYPEVLTRIAGATAEVRLDADADPGKAAAADHPSRIPMPMPAMPSRSLPQGLAADGSPTPLPPLPEENATPSSLPGSAEPCASPQVPHRKEKAPTTLDSASNKAAFTPAARPKETDTESPAEVERGDAPRPCLLRIPFNAGGVSLEVELHMTSPLLDLAKLRRPAKPPEAEK